MKIKFNLIRVILEFLGLHTPDPLKPGWKVEDHRKKGKVKWTG